jgi:hypothetical protein
MKMYNLKQGQFYALCAAVLLALPLSSAQAADPYATAQPKTDKFVVEYVYNYVEKPYAGELVFAAVDKAKISRKTPEDSFMAHFSAMTHKDYKWWLAGWDEASQKSINQRNKEKNRTEAFWTKAWENAMKDQVIKVTKRVETGPYVLIVYKMFDKSNKETFNSIYVSKKFGEEWLATEELAEDLMFQHYLDGKDRVTLNIR